MYFYSVLFPLAVKSGFVYSSERRIPPGCRVLVDFRGRQKVGVVWEETDAPDADFEVKPIVCLLDDEPAVDEELRKTLEFVSSYYAAYPGVALKAALPSLLFNEKNPVNLKCDKEGNSPVISHSVYRLSEEQKSVYQSINLEGFSVNLIFGVTGSGKTEIYLRLIEDVLKSSKKAVVLVPEIVLTPQYVEIFVSRFSESAVALYHSRLTPKKRFENYRDFCCGRKRIMIGTRSAVFVPFNDVGLVVVDEENDDSYKQENQPRYNARDIAIYRASVRGIPVVLCSATPSAESYYNAVTGKYRLFRLKKRINDVPLPEVRVETVKKEEIFTRESIEEMRRVLEDGDTVAVLINRRGFAHYLVCEDCGYLFKCPNCSVTLTYHKATNNLKCHWCDSVFSVPERCPECGSLNILERGVGAQRVEEELKKLFQNRRIERFDRDSVARKSEFDRIVSGLKEGRIDIVVGTQMLSKGHDISRIMLVVIASLEQLFSVPDFRAQEKGVALVIQTAGRAGRRKPGKVILQCTSTENETLQFILSHNYEDFLKSELKTREMFGYPPYNRLIRIICEARDENRALDKAQNLSTILREKGMNILGPVKCPLFKLRNMYRYHFLIKTKRVVSDLNLIYKALSALKIGEGVHFDVDPLSFF